MGFPTVHNLEIADAEFIDLIQSAWSVLRDDEKYPRKYRAENYFKKLSPELKDRIHSWLQGFDEYKNLKWHFEIFYCTNATGLHNDRNRFPKLDERCDQGLIIPLEWKSLTPKTKFYDLFIDEKVNWTGKVFKTLEGEIIPHPAEALKSGAREYDWETKKVLFFDSRQVHEACPFTAKPGDYKLSINGLGHSTYL